MHSQADYEKMKVDELRTLLKTSAPSMSGISKLRKAELIDELMKLTHPVLFPVAEAPQPPLYMAPSPRTASPRDHRQILNFATEKRGIMWSETGGNYQSPAISNLTLLKEVLFDLARHTDITPEDVKISADHVLKISNKKKFDLV